MHVIIRRVYWVISLATVAALLFFNFSVVHAAVRPATDADKAAIEAAGLKYVKGMLWDPGSSSVGDEVAEATRFLLERNGSGTRDTYCYRSQADRITRMNPQFRVGLYKALSEIEKQYGGKNRIQSGFRCAGVTHGSGCAADIIYASCLQRTGGNIGAAWRCSSDRFDAPEQRWIDANGKKAPYNIHLRLRYAPEGHHVEPVNTQGCRTGGVVGSGSPSGNQTPTSGIANAARNFLNPPPQPPPTPSRPLAQSSQPQLQQPPEIGADNKTAYPPGTCPPQFYCANDTYYYRSSTCVDQVQKKCAAGCSKSTNTCASTSTRETLSAIEQIDQIAEPTAEEVGTPVSDKLFELAISGEDVATLEDLSPTTTPSSTSAYTPPPPLSQQTFTSDDLRYSPAELYPPQELSAMQRVLASMKEALLRVLSYLRPFAYSTSVAEDEEWFE